MLNSACARRSGLPWSLPALPCSWPAAVWPVLRADVSPRRADSLTFRPFVDCVTLLPKDREEPDHARLAPVAVACPARLYSAGAPRRDEDRRRLCRRGR